jgi:hypothetical protein
MWHFLLRWLACLAVVAACCLPVHAQPAGKMETNKGVDNSDKVPAGQSAFAAFATLLVLVVACMPSRKRP